MLNKNISLLYYVCEFSWPGVDEGGLPGRKGLEEVAVYQKSCNGIGT